MNVAEHDDALRAVFCVPPLMLGEAPELTTDVQRGEFALAMVEAAGFDPLALRNPAIDRAWLRRHEIVRAFWT